MANPSSVLGVLERMTGAELREIAAHRGLATSGALAMVAKRIAADCRGALEALVHQDGPWTRDDWNAFVSREFHGAPRRSFEEIRAEIERGLRGAAEEVLTSLLAERVTVGDLRRDVVLMDRYAQLLGTTPRRLLNYLSDLRGNRTVASMAQELVQHFQPQARDVTEADGSAVDHDEVDRGEDEPGSVASASSEPSSRVTRPLGSPPVGHALNRRWTIVRELGRGGMGAAFEVTNRRNMVRVAKLAHGDGSDTDALVREALAGLELAHENVCRYYEIDDDTEYGVFVVMQHCGVSLESKYRSRPADPGDAIRYVAQAAAGLDYLHAKGIVHGDVSPANILVDAHGQVRLTDFGIASTLRPVTKTAGLTHVGELRGRNAAFAAEEVNRGHAPRRGSDQASLAKVLCALLSGVEQYHREPRFSFQRLGSAQAALDRALHPDIERRHESCVRFVHALMGGA